MKTRLFDLPFLFTTHPLSFICCLKAQCNPFYSRFLVYRGLSDAIKSQRLKRSLKSLDTQG